MADPLKVACPDCMAPEDVPCYSSYADGTVHADRQRTADLRALEQGTCALCGRLLVRGSVEGGPVEVWHPNPEDQTCPPLPSPREDWNAYALALQSGKQAGHPGPENFIQDTLTTSTESPVMCPECRDGKCRNCAGQALHPVTDMIVPCTCPDCGGAS